MRRLLIPAALAALCCPCPAAVVTLDAGTYSADNLGNVGWPGDFNKLDLAGIDGPHELDAGSTLDIDIATFSFAVGRTGNAVPRDFAYTGSLPLTVNGVAGSLPVPFVVQVNVLDAITFHAGSVARFDLGAEGVLDVLLRAAGPFGGLGVGDVATGTLRGRLALYAPGTAPPLPPGGTPGVVPEPSSVVLAAVGGLGLAVALRRRRFA